MKAVLVTLNGAASWDRNGDAVTYQWRQVAGPSRDTLQHYRGDSDVHGAHGSGATLRSCSSSW